MKKRLLTTLFFLLIAIPGLLKSGTISGTFTTLTSCPMNITCFTVDPTTGIFYGQGDQDNTNYYKYNTGTNTWTALTACPVPSGNNGGATYLNGKIYNSYCSNGDIQVYDIASNTWGSSITSGISTGNITSDGTNLYVAGNLLLKKYIVASNTWVDLTGTACHPWGGLQYINGYLYLHVGNGNNGFKRYKISTNTWEDLPNVPGNAVLGSAIYDAYYYCQGPYGGTNLYSYDLGAATWNNTLTLPFTTNDAAIVTYGNSLYIVQGEAGTGFTRFTPNNPMLTNMESATIPYTIGGSAVNITSNIVASQNAGVNFASATVSITGNYEQGKDVLSFTNANGITGSWSSSTGVLTLTGTASIANYQTALRSVQYSNSDFSSTSSTRTISLLVNDGSISSNTASRTITITVPPVPTLSTTAISSITETSASSGGNVTNDGGTAVTARGVVWNTSGSPTVESHVGILTDGSNGTGSYTSSLTLSAGQRYYVRAYATNSIGNGYGNELNFYTLSTEPTSQVSLTATVLNSTSIRLNFPAATTVGAAGYIILRRVDPNAGYPSSSGVIDATAPGSLSLEANTTLLTTISSSATTSYDNTSLTPGVYYRYTIIPFGYNGSNFQTYNYYVGGTPGTVQATPAVPPTMTIGTITVNSSTSVTFNGNITDNGFVNETERGFAVNTGGTPTTSDITSIESGDFGASAFNATISSFSPETQYYARSYGTNAGGTGYSSAPGTTFYTFSTEPSAHASSLSAVPASSASLTVSYPAANLISNCDGYILIRKQGSTAPDATGVADGTAPGSLSLPGGTTLVRTITDLAELSSLDGGLSAQTQYSYALIPFNWDGVHTATYNYRTQATIPTTSQYTFSSTPAHHTVSLTPSSINHNTIRLTFTAASEADRDGYILLRRSDTYPDATNITDGIATGSLVMPSGTTKIAVISNGAATTYDDATVTVNQDYFYALVPYNWDGTNAITHSYKTSGMPTTTFCMCTPTSQATDLYFSNVSRTGMTLGWTNGDGTKRLAMVKLSGISSAPLIDEQSYTANSVYGSGAPINGGYCIYNGVGSSVSVTGLTKYRLYYFRVFEYNEYPLGTTLYLQTTNSTNPRSRWTLRKDGEDPALNPNTAFSIYPNPTVDVINFAFELPESVNVTTELYTSDGRLVKSVNHGVLLAGEQKLSLGVNELPNGVYMLQIRMGEDSMLGIVEIVK